MRPETSSPQISLISSIICLTPPNIDKERQRLPSFSVLTSAPPRPCIKQRRRCPARPPAAGPIIKQPAPRPSRRPLRILAYIVRGPRSRRLPVVRGRGGAIPRARARAPPPPQTEDSSYALTHMLSAHCFSVILDARPSRWSSMRADGSTSPVNVYFIKERFIFLTSSPSLPY